MKVLPEEKKNNNEEEKTDSKGCLRGIFWLALIMSAILIFSGAFVLDCAYRVPDFTWPTSYGSELLKLIVPCVVVLIILGYFAFIRTGKK